MPYVFGVDGGGSTCRAILITDSGRVVYAGRGPSVNYHNVGASQASRVISRLFKEALATAHAKPAECRGVCMGLAGVGRDSDVRILKPLFDNLFETIPFMLVSDAEIALASGALSDSGMLVMAGTGSMVFGCNEDGLTGRVGGYGPLVSDEGGGYRIGLEAIRAILRSRDGLDGPSSLGERLLTHLNLKDADELVNWVNSEQATRERVAELAPLVIRAANEDDTAADELLNQQADLLALGVEALHRRLKFKESVPVVMSGGLLVHSSYYNQMLRRKILYLLPGAQVAPPKMEPIFGAALYAYSKAGVTISEDLIDSILTSYRDLPQEKTLTSEPEPSPVSLPESETADGAPVE
ncbi:MAG: hypothetical protein GC154_13205 [bacterium]|nr:hypothetical protein [bacterium]